MTKEHPITPPPELIKNWCASRIHEKQDVPLHVHVANQAARWGADQEVGACCQWLSLKGYDLVAAKFRDARRPKPPSLKELALEALNRMDQFPNLEDQQIVRRALEQLPDHE
jgi:hypothetical protein